jgi:SRSO17 transposase
MEAASFRGRWVTDYEFARRRVTLCRDGLPDRTVWLVVKRSLSPTPEYWYSNSNAPASAPLSLFVWMSGRRWAIEQCFEESKSELGMDHYEVRTYEGWHHHILTSMLAHFFLWRLKIRLKKNTCPDGAPVAEPVGSGVAASALDGRCEAGAGGLGAKTQSPSLLLAS